MRTLVVVACLILVACAERERLWHATRSPRVEGTWRMVFRGVNDGAPECSHDLEELVIRIDRWDADPHALSAATRDQTGAVSGGGLEVSPIAGPWAGRPYLRLGSGEVSVDGVRVPALLVYAHGPSWGVNGFATLLLECEPDDGPLAGCGYGNRLDLELLAAPGNADGSEGWQDDHVLVAVGEDRGGSQSPHELARSSE